MNPVMDGDRRRRPLAARWTPIAAAALVVGAAAIAAWRLRPTGPRLILPERRTPSTSTEAASEIPRAGAAATEPAAHGGTPFIPEPRVERLAPPPRPGALRTETSTPGEKVITVEGRVVVEGAPKGVPADLPLDGALDAFYWRKSYGEHDLAVPIVAGRFVLHAPERTSFTVNQIEIGGRPATALDRDLPLEPGREVVLRVQIAPRWLVHVVDAVDGHELRTVHVGDAHGDSPLELTAPAGSSEMSFITIGADGYSPRKEPIPMDSDGEWTVALVRSARLEVIVAGELPERTRPTLGRNTFPRRSWWMLAVGGGDAEDSLEVRAIARGEDRSVFELPSGRHEIALGSRETLDGALETFDALAWSTAVELAAGESRTVEIPAASLSPLSGLAPLSGVIRLPPAVAPMALRLVLRAAGWMATRSRLEPPYEMALSKGQCPATGIVPFDTGGVPPGRYVLSIPECAYSIELDVPVSGHTDLVIEPPSVQAVRLLLIDAVDDAPIKGLEREAPSWRIPGAGDTWRAATPRGEGFDLFAPSGTIEIALPGWLRTRYHAPAPATVEESEEIAVLRIELARAPSIRLAGLLDTDGWPSGPVGIVLRELATGDIASAPIVEFGRFVDLGIPAAGAWRIDFTTSDESESIPIGPIDFTIADGEWIERTVEWRAR